MIKVAEMSDKALLTELVGAKAAQWVVDRGGVGTLRSLLDVGMELDAGCSPDAQRLLEMMLELGVRAAKRPARMVQFTSSRDVLPAMRVTATLPYEVLVAFYLDARQRVIAETRLQGGASSVIVTPRGLITDALRVGAAGMVLAHNHPSGDPTPSQEDILLTQELYRAGRCMEVPLLDHVIVVNGIDGREQCFSFLDAGLLAVQG